MADSFDFSDSDDDFKKKMSNNQTNSNSSSTPNSKHTSTTVPLTVTSPPRRMDKWDNYHNAGNRASCNNINYSSSSSSGGGTSGGTSGGNNNRNRDYYNKDFYNYNKINTQFSSSDSYSHKKPQLPFKLNNPSSSSTSMSGWKAQPLTIGNSSYSYPYRRATFPVRPSFSAYTRNYKELAEKPLPKFSFNNNNSNGYDFSKQRKYNGNVHAEIQGYRDPTRYCKDAGIKKMHRNISKIFGPSHTASSTLPEISAMKYQEEDQSNSNSHENEKENQLISPTSFLCSSPLKTSPADPTNHPDYEFKIKLVDSYREFCKIKIKSNISLESKYETISFLKSLTTRDTPCSKLIIMLFLDRIERMFYGAAVVCLDELANKEEIDTSALELMVLRLNWIYLSEVEESELPSLTGSTMSQQDGLELLYRMERTETQLHDIKKIQPVPIKLKVSRLEELEEFFKLTENSKRRESFAEDDFELEFEKSEIGSNKQMHVDIKPEGRVRVREKFNLDIDEVQGIALETYRSNDNSDQFQDQYKDHDGQGSHKMQDIDIPQNGPDDDQVQTQPGPDSDDDFFADYE